MTTEPISFQLRDHQRTIQDWSFAGLSGELHRWVEIFDVEFKLSLPAYPVLRFASLRNAYATYGWFRNEIGTKDNITFNTNTLDRDPALTLRTLLHELLHLFQRYYGQPSQQGNYHNSEYRSKALECGLIVNARGCTCGHTEIFTSVLAKYGVHLEPLRAELWRWAPAKRETKMKKYRCRCTTVRCATKFRARCLVCKELFAPA